MSIPERLVTPDRWSNVREAIRTILVHVEPGEAAQRRTIAAAILARRLNATLVGLCAEMIQPLQFVDAFGVADAGWVAQAAQLTADNLQRAAQDFRAKTTDLSSACVTSQDFPLSAAIGLSGGADLIVAGGFEPLDRDGYRWCDPAELAIKSGSPILILPRSGTALDISRIMVAWKNTRESRRALTAALPFLKDADRVVVVSVYEDGQESQAKAELDPVISRLLRHNVKAEAQLALSAPPFVPTVLAKCAADLDANLIVAGAYGHSRLGEWVFGGVTKSLLEAGDRHLLVSH